MILCYAKLKYMCLFRFVQWRIQKKKFFGVKIKTYRFEMKALFNITYITFKEVKYFCLVGAC